MKQSNTDTSIEIKSGVGSLLKSDSSASLRKKGGEQKENEAPSSANSAEAFAESKKESEPESISVSSQESDDLHQCEACIERFKMSFIEAGQALETISARRLYRAESHETFAAYCKKRWNFAPQRADQLIGAAKVAIIIRDQVADASIPVPESEGQLRPLTRLKNLSDASAVWEKAVEMAKGKRITARLLKQAMSDGNFEAKEVIRETKPPSASQLTKRIHDFIGSVRSKLNDSAPQSWSRDDRESIESGTTALMELVEEIEACLAGDPAEITTESNG